MEKNISLPVAEGVKDVALIDFKNILIWNHQNAPIHFFFYLENIFVSGTFEDFPCSISFWFLDHIES